MKPQMHKPLFRSAQTWKIFKFALYSVAFIGVSLGAFITSISYLAVKPLQSRAPLGFSYPAEVSLMAEVLSVDPISRTIKMDWYPQFTAVDCTKDPVVMDILITQSLLDTSSPSWTAQPPYLPLYRLNTTENCLNLITTPYPSFRTVTKLLASSVYVPILPASGHSTLQNYPFDVYIASFSFSTRNAQTGAVTALNVTNSFGVAVNFEMSLQRSLIVETPLDNLPLPRLELAFRVERSKATKMFVVTVAITNWLTAAAFLIMCAATLVYRPHQIYAEMFVVPVGAVFAFTSIRTNFPGAPSGFGTTLDMYSTLPFLVIMSFCSFTLLLLILYRRIHESIGTPSQQDLEQCNMPNKEDDNPGSSILLKAQIPIHTEASSMNETRIEEQPHIQKQEPENQQLGSGKALQPV
ncbi:hypothetical protein BDZ97DRAFT_1813442 [Flammula alnicola]|nr:hypothetical protein BDZ97DRAFT_1813442 [Flammula alnicola]